MIWLVWRRQRVALLFALGVAVLVAAAAVVGRFVALGVGGDLGVLSCLDPAPAGPCESTLWDDYRSGVNSWIIQLRLALVALPVVAGAAAGAGLFGQELDRGTHVFALSQHVSRWRWWGTGMLVCGVPVAVAVGLVTVVTALAAAPFASLYPDGLLRPDAFVTTGVLPVVYTLLAFGVAAATGLLARSALVAVAVAGVVQIVVVLVLTLAVRDQYLPPVVARVPLPETDTEALTSPVPVGAVYLGVHFLDEQGREISEPDALFVGCAAQVDCLRADGIVGSVTRYHPASRYWPFQAIESGILLALVAGTLGAGLWGLRRRVH